MATHERQSDKTDMADALAGPAQPLRHVALFYRNADEYVTGMADFLREGMKAGERTVVIVPGQHVQALRAAAGEDVQQVTFVDMTGIGRNPARILASIQAYFRGAAERCLVVCEVLWPGRSDAEVREATKHEALVNLALAAFDATILCPYDAASLPRGVLADACRTHPWVAARGRQRPSPAYAGPRSVPESCDLPLTPPPAGADVIAYERDLQAVRNGIATWIASCGLPAVRAADLVLAVNEVAANTLRHTETGGKVLIWRTADEVVCQIEDCGHIANPLAGRWLPDPDSSGGYGLWLVNRFCDLTETRTGESGTTTRLHMSLTADDRAEDRPAQAPGWPGTAPQNLERWTPDPG
jgi:anti-sigma regulatory factor (Ser/Thr protein kinase)